MTDTLPPLPAPKGQLDKERGYALRQYTPYQMREYAAQVVQAERAAFHARVANDAYAMTFQTSGQYRTALLQFIRARGEKT